MKVQVIIDETNEDEREALRRKLATLSEHETIEDYFAARVADQIAVLADAVREERIRAQRALGEVLVQLPPADQEALKADLVARARANNIDTSRLEAE